MNQKYLFKVSLDEEGIRLDKFLTEKLKNLGFSRQQIIASIKEGKCKINQKVQKKPSYPVKPEDFIELEIQSPSKELSPVSGKLDILWQDQDLIVLNKPWGLSVHPSDLKKENITLVNYLIAKFPDLKNLDELRPGIVHRLDKDTSGLMIVALNKIAQKKLIKNFKRREVQKEYLAVIYGIPELLSSEIVKPIGRSSKDRKRMEITFKGKEAKTYYQVLHPFEEKNVSLVKINLLTGRTHQIRVHFASLGYPVLGDELYGKKEFLEFKNKHPTTSKLVKRQLLHSWKLSFHHPRTKKKLSFLQPIPKDIFRVLLSLFKRVQRVGITGSLGSGKSLLTKYLKELGAVTWSADEVVKKLYQPNMPGWHAITHYFGNQFLKPGSNEIDKEKLFETMLKDKRFRKDLEDIIHPIVEKDLEEFFIRNHEKRIAIAEVPLLIEVGWKKKSLFDIVVGVYCEDSLRYKWLMEKRGLNTEKIKAFELWQMDQKEKIKHVDIVVVNPGNESEYKKRAINLWKILKRLRQKNIIKFANTLKKLNVL